MKKNYTKRKVGLSVAVLTALGFFAYSYTTAGNGPLVTVCHCTSSGVQTMQISQSAVQAHMNHGDLLGACPVTLPHTTFVKE